MEHTAGAGGGDSAAGALPRSTGLQSPRVPRRGVRAAKNQAVRQVRHLAEWFRFSSQSLQGSEFWEHKLSTKWGTAGRTREAGQPIRRLCTPPKTVSSPNSAGYLGGLQITLPFRAAERSPGGR